MAVEYADHWALVTGASSGIGAEFARRLAARGMHVVLAARRRELLDELAGELREKQGVKTEVVVTDLSDPSQPASVVDELAGRGIDIELLVNNAGFGHVATFDGADAGRMAAMTQLNITALTELTYRLLPSMLERGRGGVINVASVVAFQPVAYMGVYAASKAYVLHFSEALWAEARRRGVTVMALCPGTTRTEFFESAGIGEWLKNRAAQSPGQVVEAALNGMDKGRQYVVPGWGNYLNSLLVRLAPRKTVVNGTERVFRAMVAENDGA